ncbi:hypothetical protein CCS77_0297 [Campylobacter concisus]|uniref:Uncharacterized protein n=1 Tax=Campylobacter concisus TaxID=199 RepID=A0A2R4NY60_9BACT|nr:hypothetical protein CCS77_0297 [Campylobacter concisus]
MPNKTLINLPHSTKANFLNLRPKLVLGACCCKFINLCYIYEILIAAKKGEILQSTKTSIWFLVILSGLMACTSLSTDVYLPAMPTMERQLHGDAEHWLFDRFCYRTAHLGAH